jgi:TM2 domain-containing membrane protein YozV
MNQQQLLMMLPGLQPDELMVLQSLLKDMTENQQQQFIIFYQGKRKDQQNLLILTIIGFFGVAGIQRFVIGDTALGLLYLFTGGFCGIGTIIDIINIKRMTFEYNHKQALDSANLVTMMGNS